jgi:hypothetical protein
MMPLKCLVDQARQMSPSYTLQGKELKLLTGGKAKTKSAFISEKLTYKVQVVKYLPYSDKKKWYDGIGER